ncbi:Flp family type IVb pilin [Hankyongella ginsenosidimutans]|uniref:Flp family type IVb pilin n=1 Tax=Hankyongella ginsenosidimutans TaxID=1763828 RepID=A0A4D7C0Y1_9SPHN|nr:Flp family type IVb pilin [Hankyongella ginsenosidimutans]QCI79374.1 Flp family type IVb pilin [Hankyongella ginsenosidimutans]TXG83503.1 MAG: Flp family type IVb pilin [Sphingomonadales bacterium]
MFIRKLFKNEEGATAIEYGLIAALVAIAAISAMDLMGKEVTNTFTKVQKNLETANKAADAK